MNFVKFWIPNIYSVYFCDAEIDVFCYSENLEVLKHTVSLHHLALAVQSKLTKPDSINLIELGFTYSLGSYQCYFSQVYLSLLTNDNPPTEEKILTRVVYSSGVKNNT